MGLIQIERDNRDGVPEHFKGSSKVQVNGRKEHSCWGELSEHVLRKKLKVPDNVWAT